MKRTASGAAGLVGVAVMVAMMAMGWSAGVAGAAPGRAAAGGGPVVVIDAGHGGRDSGTRSRAGVLEKDVTLAIAERVAEALRRQGIAVIMTRESDRGVAVERRVEVVNRAAPALLVSIHCDANADRSIAGYSIIVSRGASRGAAASAAAISRGLRSAGIVRHAVRSDSRGLAVLQRTSVPAVLIEVGFLSNAREAARLADARYQRKVGEAVASGIEAALHR